MALNFEHNALPGSLELAYLGDTVYDLYVRSYLVQNGGRVGKMHRQAIKLVCAHAQAEALVRIQDDLTEEEAGVVRRARNVHQSPPKNADPADYQKATGLEALIGYLYVTGQTERMDKLLCKALEIEQSGDLNEVNTNEE